MHVVGLWRQLQCLLLLFLHIELGNLSPTATTDVDECPFIIGPPSPVLPGPSARSFCQTFVDFPPVFHTAFFFRPWSLRPLNNWKDVRTKYLSAAGSNFLPASAFLHVAILTAVKPSRVSDSW